MFDAGQEVIVGFFGVALYNMYFCPREAHSDGNEASWGGLRACDGIIKWRLLLGQDLSQNSSPCKEKMSRKEKNQEETPQ